MKIFVTRRNKKISIDIFFIRLNIFFYLFNIIAQYKKKKFNDL